MLRVFPVPPSFGREPLLVAAKIREAEKKVQPAEQTGLSPFSEETPSPGRSDAMGQLVWDGVLNFLACVR